MKRYIVVRSISTLKTLKGSEVLFWEAGAEFVGYPKHVDVQELLACGAIKEVE